MINQTMDRVFAGAAAACELARARARNGRAEPPKWGVLAVGVFLDRFGHLNLYIEQLRGFKVNKGFQTIFLFPEIK